MENTESAKYFRAYMQLVSNANEAAGVRQQLRQLEADAAVGPQ